MEADPRALMKLRIHGGWFLDPRNRTVILRGVNLGGSSKVPARPDGSTHRKDRFFDYKNVSFIGRPFPVDEADGHLKRIASWGFNVLRLLIPWEALEHEGPGKYDDEYIDYIRSIIAKAADHRLMVWIDPHQDVWSRWTGGDGAPAWTLEAAGMDLKKIVPTGSAIVHNLFEGPFPEMSWPANYTRFAAATMFTLFFGGDRYAPSCRVGGEPVQRFLQNRYLNAFERLMRVLAGAENVIGIGSMNEPHEGFIGNADIRELSSWPMKNGPTPTAFEGMQAASGRSVDVRTFRFTLFGPRETGRTLLNPSGEQIWKEGCECIWKREGVWDDAGSSPVCLKPDYFAPPSNDKRRFETEFLKPFLRACYTRIENISKPYIVFMENVPNSPPLLWDRDTDGRNAADAPHWYDALTLMTKKFHPRLAVDVLKSRAVIGRRRVLRSFADQVRSSLSLPGIIGEFGLPFDLDKKRAYRDGNFSKHIKALSAYYDAMDENLTGSVLWNYTPDNTSQHGDRWNGEDLSIYSLNPTPGGRAVEGFSRPFARRIPGVPVSMRFVFKTGLFQLIYKERAGMDSRQAPAEIFIPAAHYPDVPAVEVSDGSFRFDELSRCLYYYHRRGERGGVHTVSISPGS